MSGFGGSSLAFFPGVGAGAIALGEARADRVDVLGAERIEGGPGRRATGAQQCGGETGCDAHALRAMVAARALAVEKENAP